MQILKLFQLPIDRASVDGQDFSHFVGADPRFSGFGVCTTLKDAIDGNPAPADLLRITIDESILGYEKISPTPIANHFLHCPSSFN
jgi:hypothetical protein